MLKSPFRSDKGRVQHIVDRQRPGRHDSIPEPALCANNHAFLVQAKRVHQWTTMLTCMLSRRAAWWDSTSCSAQAGTPQQRRTAVCSRQAHSARSAARCNSAVAWCPQSPCMCPPHSLHLLHGHSHASQPHLAMLLASYVRRNACTKRARAGKDWAATPPVTLTRQGNHRATMKR